jgi:hypothetical protein
MYISAVKLTLAVALFFIRTINKLMVHFIKKRLQIFVSSTFLDLKEERQAAVKAILESGHIPAGMELFTSGDESQMEVIKQWIEDSDVYLLILGGRYGSVEPNSGKSYTQLEYEYAISLNRPLFTCVMRSEYLNEKIQGSNYRDVMEQSNIDKFDKFKNLVMSKMVFQCNSLIELKYNILQKMIEIDRNDNLTGWIRASESTDSNLLSGEIAKLSQENRELKDQIEKLKKSLEYIGIDAPKGSELLAQGDDELYINYEYEHENFRFVSTWNKIFAVISPYMIDETSESHLKGVLKDYLIEETNAREMYEGTFSEYRFKIIDSDFQVIKVQLKSLGLIKKSIKKQRSVSDKQTYWILTPYGDTIMTRLRAIERKVLPSVG